MPLARDVNIASENGQEQAIPPAAGIPLVSPTHWLPHNLSPSRGPVDVSSRDGADSGKKLN